MVEFEGRSRSALFVHRRRATRATPLKCGSLRPSRDVTPLFSARTPSCASGASAAGTRAKRNVDKDDDDCQKSKSAHSHHAGMRNRSRSLRFNPGHGGYGDYDDCEAEPYEPVHDSARYKIRASRARSDTRGGSGSSSLLHFAPAGVAPLTRCRSPISRRRRLAVRVRTAMAP